MKHASDFYPFYDPLSAEYYGAEYYGGFYLKTKPGQVKEGKSEAFCACLCFNLRAPPTTPRVGTSCALHGLLVVRGLGSGNLKFQYGFWKILGQESYVSQSYSRGVSVVHLDCCSPVKKWGYRNMLSATGAIAEPVWLER